MKIKVFANELFSPYFDTETKQITCDKISNCFVCPVIKQFYKLYLNRKFL